MAERSILSRILGPKDRERKPRPHPYANEPSTEAELAVDPKRVTLFWGGLATVLVILGLWLQSQHGYISNKVTLSPGWEQWTLVPLFTGLALLGFGFNRQRWTKRVTMVGWVLFAMYWALTAKDLFIKEDQDYVNFAFAIVGVYFFVYLAYHQWLSLARDVDNEAVHFLNVTAFIAAGSYFVIAKIQFLRVWLIHLVSDHTKWMLDLFGQGEKANLRFIVDEVDPQGPVWFFYPDKYCSTGRGDLVSEYCATLPPGNGPGFSSVRTYPTSDGSFWQDLLFYNNSPDGIVPVSIILACTAIQSIMLFVGLFFGTNASLKRKIQFSVIVGAVVYVLNLVRNTGIIWFYGQGHSSFWTMHNAIGKGGSLLAMVGIAFAVFKWFPEFFQSLVNVLDLPDRDGPIERTLKIGRRRPEPVASQGEGTSESLDELLE